MFTLKGKVTPFYFKIVAEGEESTEFCKVEEIEPTYSIDNPRLIGIKVTNDDYYENYAVEHMIVRLWYLSYRLMGDMDFVECSEEEFNQNLEKVKQKLNLK